MLLQQCLEKLLNMPEIADIISRPEPNNTQDVHDGLYLNSHTFFKLDPEALLLLLYVDNFEIVNSIGTHRVTHEFTIYYMQLLNISPVYHSKLELMQLVSIAKTTNLNKFGFDNLKKNIVSDVNKIYCKVKLNFCDR